MTIKVVLRRRKYVNLRNSVLTPTIISSSGHHGEKGAVLPAYQVRIREKYYISFQGAMKGDANIYVTFPTFKHDSKCDHVCSPDVRFGKEPGVSLRHDSNNITFLSGVFSTIGLFFRALHKCKCPMMVKISGTIGQDYINDTLLMVNTDSSPCLPKCWCCSKNQLCSNVFD